MEIRKCEICDVEISEVENETGICNTCLTALKEDMEEVGD
jgi:hypothetical protein